MKTLEYEELERIMKANCFELEEDKPLVVVFRNTGYNGLGSSPIPFYYEEDTGDNCCDLILLVNSQEESKNIVALEGRSLPHRRYQERMVKGTGRANRITTGYYRRCWKKGRHRGYRALVQCRPFVILRSSDMLLGNEDDWFEYGEIIADNLHAHAPYSAGCVTIGGKARPRLTGHWAYTDKWLYEYNSDQTYFSAVILNHSDLEAKNRLRVGSQGPLVEEHQLALNGCGEDLKEDGIYGSLMHQAVCEFQGRIGAGVDGIIGPITTSALEDESRILLSLA